MSKTIVIQEPSLKYAAEEMDEFQPGSKGRVLRNKMGIVKVKELDEVELRLYMEAMQKLRIRPSASSPFSMTHRFTMKDIDYIHFVFLGELYEWAGKHRTVNISKGGFTFATAYALSSVVHEFEQNVLTRVTPCTGEILEDVALKIAEAHVELLLLHPYREGNGRTARLFANLMAQQAGLLGADFGFIGKKGKEYDAYLTAVQSGLLDDYLPMQTIVLRALKRALRFAASKDFLR